MSHEPEYIETTIHKFKSNIARYLRAMEEGRCKGVILNRNKEPVAAVILHPKAAQRLEDMLGAARAEDKRRKTPYSGPDSVQYSDL